ncbi:hypothetical protein ACYULU_10920 [Breznakiellaceae bacterium SP9]
MDFNEEEAVTFEQMRDLIIELKLPQSILDLYDGKCEIAQLQNDFKDPYAIFHCAKDKNNLRKVQDGYLVTRYKPILSYAFETIFAYDIITKKYVKYSIELFDEKDLEPMSWDSLFIEYINLLWELAESEKIDPEIIKIGETLGIKSIKLILESIIKANEMKYEEWQLWKKELIKTIDAMI